MESSKFIIGLDVGGTNTYAVIVEYPSSKIHSAVKTPTTRDIFSGVTEALKRLLKQASHIEAKQIFAVNLGTTAFLNAFLECSDELAPVALFRLCKPASDLVRPFINFTPKLRAKLELAHFCCKGGLEYNREEISAVDPEEIEASVEQLVEVYKKNNLNILNIVVSAIFRTLDD